MRNAKTVQAKFAQVLRGNGVKASVKGKGHLRRVFEYADRYNGQLVRTYTKQECDALLRGVTGAIDAPLGTSFDFSK